METSKKSRRQVYICFFIVRLREDGTFAREWTYPKEACSEKEFKQYQNFCFPIAQSENATDLKSQHFTYMLTDIDTSRKYGFCKLIESGNSKLCYCFLSEFSWFEIFYKCLNCVCTVHVRSDINTLRSIIEKFYSLSIPKAKDIVSLSTSLTFSVPDETMLPSIPENRNLVEYISTITPRNMIDIYAAFMFERRIIFTSSNLSVISGCIFAAEGLLQPLSWQHIFIPLLHRHIIEYCSAPMPYIIGMHSSLFKRIEGTQAIEDVVIVDIDSNSVTSEYDDVHKLPAEVVSYLRHQLGKPNISVGSTLSQVFLRTQARLFGEYRAALKFRMGETISFDEDKFIASFKTSGGRSFAEQLIHSQPFRQFIDERLHKLNNGIGFHDLFEKEVSELQQEYDYATVYKEWISRKRSEVLYDIKTNMKLARSSAKQSMKDMKNVLKSSPKELHKELSLHEDIASLRPPRPPRPPPPQRTSKTVTRFKMIESDEVEPKQPEPTYLDAPTKSNIEELLIDLSFDKSPKKTSSPSDDFESSWLNATPNSYQDHHRQAEDNWAQELLTVYDQNMQSPTGVSPLPLINGFDSMSMRTDQVAEAPTAPTLLTSEKPLISFD